MNQKDTMTDERNPILQAAMDKFPDEEFLTADGLEDAIIGIDEESMRVIYSVEKCIDILAEEMQVTEDDLDEHEKKSGYTIDDKKRELAIEHFGYNVEGSYVGPKTPIWDHGDEDEDSE